MFKVTSILKSPQGGSVPELAVLEYGIDATLSEAGSYDRLVVQEILKEIAQTQQVDLNAKQRFKGLTLVPSFLEHVSNFFGSGDNQRSGLSLPGRPGRSEKNDGEVHVEHANYSLCQQHKQVDCADQESMPTYAGGSSK